MATETATETAGDATPTAATATSEEAEAPRRVDGTVGKTIEDFVEGFNFKETPSGRKYVTFVKNKYWPNYKKEKKLGDGEPCVLVLTDSSGEVTKPHETRVRSSPLSFIIIISSFIVGFGSSPFYPRRSQRWWRTCKVSWTRASARSARSRTW